MADHTHQSKAELLKQARNPKAKKKKVKVGRPKRKSGLRKKTPSRAASAKAIDKIVRGKK